MTRPRILDLFAGAGGWEEGLRGLGHRALGIDADPWACATASAAGHERVEADIASLDPDQFGPVRGLIASPPCQAWSTAGKGLGRLDRPQVVACAHELALGTDSREERLAACRDPRSLLSVEPLRWALALRPRWIALEQVPPVLELWSHLCSLLAAHGYQAACGILSAERYGVPQTRRRAFLIASLDGPVALPEPTHRSYDVRRKPGKVPESEEGLRPWVSMAEAIGAGGDEGIVWTNNQTDSGRRPRGLRRPLAAPSRTLDTASGSWTIEPSDPLPGWASRRPATTVLGTPRIAAPGARDRDPAWRPGDPWPSQFTGAVRITIAQASVLQGFPVDYPWQGARTVAMRQIGNAVCPPLARLVLAAAMAPGDEGTR